MLQDAADVPLGQPAQTRVAAFVIEQGLAVLPQTLMGMHAGAVIGIDRLGHECHGLAVSLGHVFDHVFVKLHVVGHLQHRVETHVDLALPGRADFMVMQLDAHARRDQRAHHLGPQVLKRIHRRDGKVAALVGHRVPEAEDTGVPGAFDAVDLIGRRVFSGRVHDLVENEKLRLRAKIGRVGDAGAHHVLKCLARHVARVAGVGIATHRIIHIANQAKRRRFANRIDDGGRRIADQDHVARLDALKAANRGTVKAQTFLKSFILVVILDRQRKVLPLTE